MFTSRHLTGLILNLLLVSLPASSLSANDSTPFLEYLRFGYGFAAYPRYSHAFVYNAAHDDFIVFGGMAESGTLMSDTWIIEPTDVEPINTDVSSASSSSRWTTRTIFRWVHLPTYLEPQRLKDPLFWPLASGMVVVGGESGVEGINVHTWRLLRAEHTWEQIESMDLTIVPSLSSRVAVVGGSVGRVFAGFGFPAWQYGEYTDTLATNYFYAHRNPLANPAAVDSEGLRGHFFVWPDELTTGWERIVTPDDLPPDDVRYDPSFAARVGPAVATLTDSNGVEVILVVGGRMPVLQQPDPTIWYFYPRGQNVSASQLPPLWASQRYPQLASWRPTGSEAWWTLLSNVQPLSEIHRLGTWTKKLLPYAGTMIAEVPINYHPSYISALNAISHGSDVYIFNGWTLAHGSNFTWILRNALEDPQWELVSTSTPGPSPRFHCPVAMAPTGLVMLFGGLVSGPSDPILIAGDLWSFSVQDSVWFKYHDAQIRPPQRAYQCMISIGLTPLVAFGMSTNEEDQKVVFNDVWALTLSDTLPWHTLTFVSTSEQIPGRHSACMVSWATLALAFGGATADGTPLDDLWELTMVDAKGNLEEASTWMWRQIVLDNSPPARFGHSCAMIKSIMVVFGGQSGNTYFNDLYAYDITARLWAPIITSTNVSGSVPLPGYFQTGSMLPVGRSYSGFHTMYPSHGVLEFFLLFGGQRSSVTIGDAWILEIVGRMSNLSLLCTWKQMLNLSSPLGIEYPVLPFTYLSDSMISASTGCSVYRLYGSFHSRRLTSGAILHVNHCNDSSKRELVGTIVSSRSAITGKTNVLSGSLPTPVAGGSGIFVGNGLLSFGGMPSVRDRAIPSAFSDSPSVLNMNRVCESDLDLNIPISSFFEENHVTGVIPSEFCFECGAGWVPSSTGDCEPCARGTYASVADISCRPCPNGTFGLFHGATAGESCLPCESDQYQPLKGSSSCINCPPNQTCFLGAYLPIEDAKLADVQKLFTYISAIPAYIAPTPPYFIWIVMAVVSAFMFGGVVLGTSFCRPRLSKLLTAVDLFAKSHFHEPGDFLRTRNTYFGGIVSLFFVLGLLLFFSVMFIDFLYKNVREYRSLQPASSTLAEGAILNVSIVLFAYEGAGCVNRSSPLFNGFAGPCSSDVSVLSSSLELFTTDQDYVNVAAQDEFLRSAAEATIPSYAAYQGHSNYLYCRDHLPYWDSDIPVCAISYLCVGCEIADVNYSTITFSVNSRTSALNKFSSVTAAFVAVNVSSTTGLEDDWDYMTAYASSPLIGETAFSGKNPTIFDVRSVPVSFLDVPNKDDQIRTGYSFYAGPVETGSFVGLSDFRMSGELHVLVKLTREYFQLTIVRSLVRSWVAFIASVVGIAPGVLTVFTILLVFYEKYKKRFGTISFFKNSVDDDGNVNKASLNDDDFPQHRLKLMLAKAIVPPGVDVDALYNDKKSIDLDNCADLNNRLCRNCFTTLHPLDVICSACGQVTLSHLKPLEGGKGSMKKKVSQTSKNMPQQSPPRSQVTQTRAVTITDPQRSVDLEAAGPSAYESQSPTSLPQTPGATSPAAQVSTQAIPGIPLVPQSPETHGDLAGAQRYFRRLLQEMSTENMS